MKDDSLKNRYSPTTTSSNDELLVEWNENNKNNNNGGSDCNANEFRNDRCKKNNTTSTNKISSSNIRYNKNRIVPRHIKGTITIAIFVIANTVSYSHCISFWSQKYYYYYYHQETIDLKYSTSTTNNNEKKNNKSRQQQQQQQQKQKQKITNNRSTSSIFASATSIPVAETARNVCSTTGSSNLNQEICTKRTMVVNPILSFVQGLTKRNKKSFTIKTISDCCSYCTDCMDTKLMKQMGCDTTTTATTTTLLIPRGGSVAAAATTATTIATSTTTPYGIPLTIWKLLLQVLLTTMNVGCWYIPLKSKHISQNKYMLSIANSFSGGVFLSLAFGHLIPECINGFTTHASKTMNPTTPYMLVLTGYLLIFFVEKVAFSNAHDALVNSNTSTDSSSSSNKESNIQTKNNNPIVSMNGHSTSQNGNNKSVSSISTSTTNSMMATTTTSTSSNSSSGRGAVILLCALAVHSVLEMMALGLADTFSDCLLLTISISLHQPAESIALLVAFIKSGLSQNQIIYFLSIFSCMGPIGVIIGIIVNQYASPIVDSIMLAIVAGTFVYVGATEVIPEEFDNHSDDDDDNNNTNTNVVNDKGIIISSNNNNYKWHKFSSLIAGIVSIYAITQYTMTLH